MSASKSFVFVTGNANKLKEVQAILAAGTSGISVTNQAVDLPEIQGTTQEVAIAKCKAAARELGTAVVTEDTALCFEALNDLPGPYIKDFLGRVGHEGLQKMVQGFDNDRAYALCTFAYSNPSPTTSSSSSTSASGEPEVKLFEGKTYGKIVQPRGPRTFGWDCCFEPDEGEGLTFAEMKKEDKNKISHRFRALEQLKDYLSAQ